jgi:hypothetical protein
MSAFEAPVEGADTADAFFQFFLGMAVRLIDRFGRFAEVMEVTELVGDRGQGLFDGGTDRGLSITDHTRNGHAQGLLDLAQQLRQVVLGR